VEYHASCGESGPQEAEERCARGRSIRSSRIGALRRARRLARWRRPLAKSVATLQLLKSAATFGDWLPYALWKLERHTGTHLDLSERQRRHPFVFGWPLIARVLWRRELR